MDKQVRSTIRITAELNSKLESLAKQKGVSKNALIVQVLWKLVEKQCSH